MSLRSIIDRYILREPPICECPDDCPDCDDMECCGKCAEWDEDQERADERERWADCDY